MNETWIPIPGYEALYAVSSNGAVKRLNRKSRNGQCEFTLSEREMKPSLSRGYLRVNLWENNRSKSYFIHRLVMLAFVGESDLSVDHINGIKTDNRLENLRYCTLRENTIYQHEAGRVRFVRGVENGKAKMTDDVVREARMLLQGGASTASVANAFGMSKGAIQAMREGRTWRHVL